jgi:pyruvyltransferase
MIKAFWYKSNNFGDQLTHDVLEFFLKEEIKLADRNETGKLMGIGSIMTALRNNDVVWGSGSIRPAKIKGFKNVRFLAVRGPLTRDCIEGYVPEVYGDPGLLLPLIYNPTVEKIYKIGLLPHYVDKMMVVDEKILNPEKDKFLVIDIERPWKEVIDNILSCEKIITSSLHGIIAAEAYGIPVKWVKYSDKIIGGTFKFDDYFLGTGREFQRYGEVTPMINLKERQDVLINALKKQYGKN